MTDEAIKTSDGEDRSLDVANEGEGAQASTPQEYPEVPHEVGNIKGRVLQAIDDHESKQDTFQRYLEQLPKVNGAIDLSQFNKIGSGGTHDVYQFENDQSCVVKIDRGVLAKIKEWGYPRKLTGELAEQADSYIQKKNADNDTLYKHMGQDGCIKEKAVKAKITIPTENGPIETETVVVVQEKSEAFAIKDAVDFGTDYKGNIRGDIESRIKTDLLFRAKLAEFLTRFREYYAQTGKFIDLVGEKNVLFFKDQNGRWQYVVGSVVKGNNISRFEEAYDKFIVDPKNLSKADKDSLRNGAVLTSLVNKTGNLCGIGKVVETRVSDEEIERIINELS